MRGYNDHMDPDDILDVLVERPIRVAAWLTWMKVTRRLGWNRRIHYRAGASVCSEYPECRSLDDDCGGCWACDGGSNNTPPPCNPASCGDGHTCRASEESA